MGQESKLFGLVERGCSDAAIPFSEAIGEWFRHQSLTKQPGDSQPVKGGRNGAGQDSKRRSGDNSGYITTPGPAVAWLLEEQIPGNQEGRSAARHGGVGR